MSYGPQLPPHLMKKKEESDSESDSESYGPKLPDTPCRGPKPTSSNNKADSNSEDEDAYGPRLPPNKTSGNPVKIGPQIPGSTDNNEASEEEDDDDDDMIGPMPPKPGEEMSSEAYLKRNFEERASRMQDQLEGKNKTEEPKRESWMLTLPTTKAKNFGLGPRTFSKSTNPKPVQDKSWTETPQDRARKAAGLVEDESDNKDPSQDPDVLAYMASLKRDQEMEKMTQELRKKRGSESLMESHQKKMKQKQKQDDKPKERKPFDRETDLQVNRFDDAQKKAMIKKAANIDSRFSSGQSKYL